MKTPSREQFQFKLLFAVFRHDPRRYNLLHYYRRPGLPHSFITYPSPEVLPKMTETWKFLYILFEVPNRQKIQQPKI